VQCIVKVVLREEKDSLCELAKRLITKESKMFCTALMRYAKDLSMIKENVYCKKLLYI
jgi:hypothetical protein